MISGRFGEALAAHELERFALPSRIEILDVLRALIARRAPLTVYFNHGSEFIVSCLLAVNPDFEELVFDCSADENANSGLMRSPHIHFVTELEQVRIQFASPSAEPIACEGLLAMRVRIPETVLRLQRRDDYRVALPIARPLLARVPDPRHAARAVELRALNLSRGGVALADTLPPLPLEAGVVLEGCSLSLPDGGRVAFDAEVRNIVPGGAPGGEPRCGLRFLGVHGSALAQIQRAVLRLDRAHRPLR